MPKVRECTLIRIDTGQQQSFESVIAAEAFLKKKNGYIRRMLQNGQPLSGDDGYQYSAKLGKIKKVPLKEPIDYTKMQLCWRCQKACGGCSWSRSFIPIEGWTATESIIMTQSRSSTIHSFAISACPEFEFG